MIRHTMAPASVSPRKRSDIKYVPAGASTKVIPARPLADIKHLPISPVGPPTDIIGRQLAPARCPKDSNGPQMDAECPKDINGRQVVPTDNNGPQVVPTGNNGFQVVPTDNNGPQVVPACPTDIHGP